MLGDDKYMSTEHPRSRNTIHNKAVNTNNEDACYYNIYHKML